MAFVVFLRGVNVGGRKAFQPSALARELADFDAVNLGAAGTFVVREAPSQAVLRNELARRLPFEAEVMICRSREILELAEWTDFPPEASQSGVTRYVSVLAKRPRTLPKLPLGQPEGDQWQVKVFAVPGRFALGLHRRVGRSNLYPNEVVEKRLGVSATTRNWTTLVALSEILQRA